MKPPLFTGDPPRWRADEARATDAPTDEQRIGRLLRRMPPPAPLAPTQFRAVAQRLAAQLQTPAQIARPGRWGAGLRRRWAMIVALVAGTSGVVFAQWQRAHVRHEAAAARIATATAPASASAVREFSGAPAPAPTIDITDRAATEEAATPSRSTPAPKPRARVARDERGPVQRTLALRDARVAPGVITPPAAPLPSSRTARLPDPDHSRLPLLSDLGASSTATRTRDGRLAGESILLREALQSLRHDDDARGALDTLDEYDQRFPFGALRPNAALVRIDATLALGRREEARRLIEQIDLRDSPRRDELEVTRAELRSPGECRAALADFSAVLARDPIAAVAERALRGRARCHVSLGHDDDARADLATYLERFPGGALAAEARRRLGR
jgi:hypothetical protein